MDSLEVPVQNMAVGFRAFATLYAISVSTDISSAEFSKTRPLSLTHTSNMEKSAIIKLLAMASDFIDLTLLGIVHFTFPISHLTQ